MALPFETTGHPSAAIDRYLFPTMATLHTEGSHDAGPAIATQQTMDNGLLSA